MSDSWKAADVEFHGLTAAIRLDPDQELAVYGPEVTDVVGEAFARDLAVILSGIGEIEMRSAVDYVVRVREVAVDLAATAISDIAGSRVIRSRVGDYFAEVRIGVACSSTAGHSAVAAANAAAAALNEANAARESLIVADDSLLTRVRERSALARRLASSRLTQFTPDYQPIVDLNTREIVGFEALLRWSEGGRMLLPAEFLDVAERTSMLVAIGRHVTVGCIGDLGQLIDASYGAESFLTVNMSRLQLSDRGLPSLVLASLEENGMPPDRLWIEVSEHDAIDLTSVAARTLRELNELGCVIAVDDLGAGYSALRYVSDLDVGVVKLDRGLVAELIADRERRAFVRHVCDLAHGGGARIVAEGIEDSAVLPVLGDLGVEFAQGYHFGRPAPAGTYFGRRPRVRTGGFVGGNRVADRC